MPTTFMTSRPVTGILKHATPLVIALSVLNIVFACALAGIVATQLDYQPSAPYCYLNVQGQVCIFTYITTGAILLFSLSIILPILYIFHLQHWSSTPTPRLVDLYFQISAFSLFWQIVMSTTITIRGNQATDAGVPNTSARTAAMAFGWLGVALSFIVCLLVLIDVYAKKKEDDQMRDLHAPLGSLGSIDESSGHHDHRRNGDDCANPSGSDDAMDGMKAC